MSRFRQGGAGRRHCRICQTRTPLRRSRRENRIVTGSEAAPAAERGSRNLLMRVIAALILAPAAIAIAWAGGWLWAGLVTMAAIGLYVEWLMIVGAARQKRAAVAGIVGLACSGLGLALGALDVALACIISGLVGVVALSGQRRGW